MKQAHTDMAVTAAEFDAQVEVLVASLNHVDVPQAEQDELLALLAPMRDRRGGITGDGLPESGSLVERRRDCRVVGTARPALDVRSVESARRSPSG